MLASGEEATQPDIIYGVWLVKKILSYAEWKDFKIPEGKRVYPPGLEPEE